ncbi:chymotrypsinogen B-like [Ornithodoros turicata]|uniref:chymotrypsinogen B-like n=1 Tax=Ornithodoros turicata TaxID=34597 RepID=UPI00313A1B38
MPRRYHRCTLHSAAMEGIVVLAAALAFSHALPPGVYRSAGLGEDADPHKYPWLGALYTDDMFHCNAAVLNDSWILTNHLCLNFRLNNAWFGRYDLSVDEPSGQRRTFAEVVGHPQFNGTNFNYDFALLKLSTPLEFNEYVSAVALPNGDDDIQDATCTATGWNVYNRPDTYDPQGLDQLQVVPQKDCEEKYGPDRDYLVTETKFCASYAVCDDNLLQYALAAPMVCAKQDGKPQLSGLVEFATSCTKPRPPLVNRVGAAVKWITATITSK